MAVNVDGLQTNSYASHAILPCKYGMAASIKGLVNRLGPLRTIIGLRLFINNLLLIAKCTYATPDPVQPDQHYLPVCTALCLLPMFHASLQPMSPFCHT